MHEALEKRIKQMLPILNEKQLRRYLGSEAEALGFGGIAIVSKISGKSRNTIVAGMRENGLPEESESPERVRKSGGGRKAIKKKHPDRNTQFEYINSKVKQFLESGDPVISIDARKKELTGNFKNNDRAYNEKKNPAKVLDHDFPLKELGKVPPYGIYDINRNEGFVNLGISKDASEFAVESISRWWLSVGKNTYPNASRLYINCNNGARNKLFKLQLQEFTNYSDLEVHVSYFPPGTTKWNKIEHRLFCYISSHWRRQPLISIEATIDLIGSITTTSGLKVICVKDENTYKIGVKVSDDDFEKINIKKETTYPDWNYIISPNK